MDLISCRPVGASRPCVAIRVLILLFFMQSTLAIMSKEASHDRDAEGGSQVLHAWLE